MFEATDHVPVQFSLDLSLNLKNVRLCIVGKRVDCSSKVVGPFPSCK